MSAIIISTLILVFIYKLFCKRLSYKLINKKLLRALITSIMFSMLDIVKLFLLSNQLPLKQITYYVVVDSIIILASIGMYTKNRMSGMITFIFTVISIYGDYLINKSEVMPFIVFIIYLRSLLYFDIFWDGTMGIFAYYRKLRIDD